MSSRNLHAVSGSCKLCPLKAAPSHGHAMLCTRQCKGSVPDASVVRRSAAPFWFCFVFCGRLSVLALIQWFSRTGDRESHNSVGVGHWGVQGSLEGVGHWVRGGWGPLGQRRVWVTGECKGNQQPAGSHSCTLRGATATLEHHAGERPRTFLLRSY